jgi:hypothetical protein
LVLIVEKKKGVQVANAMGSESITSTIYTIQNLLESKRYNWDRAIHASVGGGPHGGAAGIIIVFLFKLKMNVCA